jgi:hypothetical protein
MVVSLEDFEAPLVGRFPSHIPASDTTHQKRFKLFAVNKSASTIEDCDGVDRILRRNDRLICAPPTALQR